MVSAFTGDAARRALTLVALAACATAASDPAARAAFKEANDSDRAGQPLDLSSPTLSSIATPWLALDTGVVICASRLCFCSHAPPQSPWKGTIPMSASASQSGRLSAAAAALTRGPAILSILFLVACASVPTDPEARAAYDRANDPAEPTNRAIFAGNQFVDRNALRPAARAYQDYVPSRVRKSFHNFVSNLKEPEIAVNDVLQANFSRAWNTTQRFVINSTVGGAGLFDVASDWDRPHHDADFGETFGVWGIGPGPSVQLPLFGPSNVRDAVGKVAGFIANPLGFIPGGTMSTIELAGGGVGVVDGRADLLIKTDALEKTSLDYYASLRSIEAQRRAALVEEGRVGRVTIGPVTPVPDVTLSPPTP
jgi:phospholipid-binding lipoprotein MlaA